MLGDASAGVPLVTGGVQGLDRYAYVNNSPMVYVDPSGHESVCNTKYSDPECVGGDVPLTKAGDPVPGTGKFEKYGGSQVKKLYELMTGCTSCWWYNNGEFTFKMFIGFMIMGEANYLQGDALAMDAIKQIFAQRFYVGGGNGDTDPYCGTGQCYNGAFNYMAATSQTVRTLIDKFVIGGKDIAEYMGPGSVGQHAVQAGGNEQILTALNKAKELGNYAINPIQLYGRYEGPSEYGNDISFASALRTNNIPTNHINGVGSHTIYLYFGNRAN